MVRTRCACHFFFCVVLTYGGFVGRFSCTETIVKKDKPYFVPVWYKKFGENDG